jgi:phosphoribosylaminoimidazolecarboxamide formyltransferase / IMP cyclohydrolase
MGASNTCRVNAALACGTLRARRTRRAPRFIFARTTMASHIAPKRALLSVSDKRGLLPFARALVEQGVMLISTGGTATVLREAGLSVVDVETISGFPEMMDGRVKTLHPKVHGALLGRSEIDARVMQEHDIYPIDLVVVNLYPFAQTIAKPDCTDALAVENIDIGGPAMLRSAAKNHARVLVLCDPADYAQVQNALSTNGNDLALRRKLAAKVYAHTGHYDAIVAQYLGQTQPPLPREPEQKFPAHLLLAYERAELLRYGENPHQQAALYLEAPAQPCTAARAEFKQGKALSYNNLVDADAALECVKLFDEPCCVIVKHANPCGVAKANALLSAYQRAFETDPVSAFGGIIALNRSVEEDLARCMMERQFIEVVIAPEFSAGALAAFASKPNVRVLACGAMPSSAIAWRDYKRVQGALLVQDGDTDALSAADFQVVTERAPSASEFSDLLFAWKVAMQVKSNAIVYAKDARTIGIGAGQMSRVISAKIAGMKAQEANLSVQGSVMASDAFFPFRDGIDAAAQVGIRAVVQPGGSMRDKEVIEAANAHGIAMVFTSVRHFKH